MKHVVALIAVLATGVVASFALAAPPAGKGPEGKCHPVNLKGTVDGGTISLKVTKASGPKGKQLLNSTATLSVGGNVSVQAWDCSAPGSSAAPQLKLRQLHVGGSPQAP
jgi:hypothetical protein